MPKRNCNKRNNELLREKRRADEKDQVVAGVMVFISVVMVLLFLHGITTQDLSEAPGVFFVIKCMGYFVVFALPLLIWNVCRLIKYTGKRKRGADYYVYDEVTEEEGIGVYDRENGDLIDQFSHRIGKDKRYNSFDTDSENEEKDTAKLDQLLLTQGMVLIEPATRTR